MIDQVYTHLSSNFYTDEMKKFSIPPKKTQACLEKRLISKRAMNIVPPLRSWRGAGKPNRHERVMEMTVAELIK